MQSSRILIDTGPIVAVLCRSDEHHAECSRVLSQFAAPLLTCWPVLTEAAWLLRRNPIQVRRLLSHCGGYPIEILPLTAQDLPGIAAVLEKYEDLGVQLADAALLHLAGREQLQDVFTLDRRHFSLFRLASGKPLTLLP